MKYSQSPRAFRSWQSVITAWLSTPDNPHYFTTNRPPDSCLTSLRQAILGHIRYSHPGITVSSSQLEAVWSKSKLTFVREQPDGQNLFCLCPLGYTPDGAVSQSGKSTHHAESSGSIKLTINDQPCLTSLLNLVNAGVFSSSGVAIILQSSIDHLVEQFESHPNIAYEPMSDDTYILL